LIQILFSCSIQRSAADEIAQIEDALFQVEHFTCLKYVKRTTEVDYVSVTVSKSRKLYKKSIVNQENYLLNRANTAVAIQLLAAVMAHNR
jgi:hypothetical protein